MNIKRILLVRTDRIGDCILTTPCIKAVRDKYPDSYIGFLTRVYTKDIVEGNPYLDDVIIFDRIKNGWFDFLAAIKLAIMLRKKRFEVAVILNPNARANIIIWLARITERIGYNRKWPFLLTQRIEDKKWQGKFHELEYTLEMLKTIGVDSGDKTMYMPIKEENAQFVDKFLNKNTVKENDLLIGIQCGASCPSKIWPPERFSKVADMLIDKFKCKIFLFCGSEESSIKDKIVNAMHHRPIIVPNFSVGQIACLLKRANLLISNDSGPVHISVAVGTSVISIFGRNLSGLGPVRWRPLGKNDIYIHKDVGCKECLAHNCKIGFKCLQAITTDEVFNAAKNILRQNQKD